MLMWPKSAPMPAVHGDVSCQAPLSTPTWWSLNGGIFSCFITTGADPLRSALSTPLRFPSSPCRWWQSGMEELSGALYAADLVVMSPQCLVSSAVFNPDCDTFLPATGDGICGRRAAVGGAVWRRPGGHPGGGATQTRHDARRPVQHQRRRAVLSQLKFVVF